jgi:O-antigen ligase
MTEDRNRNFAQNIGLFIKRPVFGSSIYSFERYTESVTHSFT